MAFEKIEKIEVLDALLRGEVELEFSKLDGTSRNMIATLREDLLTPYESKSGKTRKKNEDVCVVFDTYLDEWRSFRWDSLIYWEYLESPPSTEE